MFIYILDDSVEFKGCMYCECNIQDLWQGQIYVCDLLLMLKNESDHL